MKCNIPQEMMDANRFVANLKANDDESDKCDLAKSYKEYSEILGKLSTKDKNSFSLNVLCTLCRNLEKAATWRDRIDTKELLRLSIECVRHTRTLEGPEQVKTLACVYHVHKYVIKQNLSAPAELVLKLSIMPFEYEHDCLLKEYCKTYWSILADRLTYIEKLKTKRVPVTKLLPRLIEDALKIIQIYDTVQFCSSLLVFLVKKLHVIFSGASSKELNEMFGKIFVCISKKDLKKFKSISESEALDLYIKFNDCLYIITENSSRNNFKDSVLDSVTRVCIALLGHRSDMFHCYQTYFLNSFCFIFKDITDASLLENIFNTLYMSCEMTEKLGYKATINATYPYISQLIKLFIEYNVNNPNKYTFNEHIIQNCLKLMLILIKKSAKTNQSVKCENCAVRTGLHDGLRLSFLIKHLLNVSIDHNIPIVNTLPLYYELVEEQYTVINELKRMKCVNQEKCFKKLQTDVHNTAIMLNKSQNYEYSIKLFEIYLQNEMNNIKNDVEMKNISRALYNKSICELEYKCFEESLKNAYLSFIFSLPEGLESEKFMSLVMDVKAKALKSVSDDGDNDDNNELQMMSVLEMCKRLYDDNSYGDLKPYIKDLEFSVLLQHEFSMYVKLWPSMAPVAGVWTALHQLLSGGHSWAKSESPPRLQWALYEVVLQTPGAVRTMQHQSYRRVLADLLLRFNEQPASCPRERLVSAALQLLQADYDLADASRRHGWKAGQAQQLLVRRSVQQEHGGLARVQGAVAQLARAGLADVSPQLVRVCLQVLQAWVPQLQLLQRLAEALQLALLCCQLAERAGDDTSLVLCAGVLVHECPRASPRVLRVLTTGMQAARRLLAQDQHCDTALGFLCEAAMYYGRAGCPRLSGRLLRLVQGRLLSAAAAGVDVNTLQSPGRLLQAQAALCPAAGLGLLSAVNAVQRHYLALPNTCSAWLPRRARGARAAAALSQASAEAARAPRALRLLSRAAAAAAPAGPRCSALTCALLSAACVEPARTHDAQVAIDNHLKFVLGLHPAGSVPLDPAQSPKREQPSPPRAQQLESMLDSVFQRTQLSPSLPCASVPACRPPPFLLHPGACACYACAVPACAVVACLACSLEASMYYRAKEFDIARNYFDGALAAFGLAEMKLKNTFEEYKKRYDDVVVEITREVTERHFRIVQLEFLIELCLFDLSRGEIEKSDDTMVRIHELLADATHADDYLRHEVTNLMIASAQYRKVAKTAKETGLENELENLKLSPAVATEPQTTPDTKHTIPQAGTAVIVKDEDIPKKRKVIKLNFDDVGTEEVEEKGKRKHQFKIPEPVTTRPVLEKMTPRPTRSRPEIVVQQPSVDESIEIYTPKSVENGEFFTPCQSTPSEQFFTPMTSLKTSLKTYSKRVVKNLEAEFSTPKSKENTLAVENKPRTRSRVETGSVHAIKDKRTLKRATSPGKLPAEKPTRTRRIRQPTLLKNDK